MNKATAITCVFIDIGGVLLTNGWDHEARKRAATNFKLEWAEMEDRHLPTCRTKFYEYGSSSSQLYSEDLTDGKATLRCDLRCLDSAVRDAGAPAPHPVDGAREKVVGVGPPAS